MHRDIYKRLKEVARAGQTITYGEIAPMANLNMESPADRNYPGKGFFTLAQELGIYDGADDLAFFVRELCRVHEYWQRAE